MGKKKGTNVEIANKIKEFLKANKGQTFPVDHLARELGVGWRRIARLLKVATILKGVQELGYGKNRLAYMIPSEGE